MAVVGSALGLALVLAAPTLAEALAGPARQEAVAEYLRALAFFVPLSAIETVVVSATRGFGSILPLVVVTNVAQPVVRLTLVAVAVGTGAERRWSPWPGASRSPSGWRPWPWC